MTLNGLELFEIEYKNVHLVPIFGVPENDKCHYFSQIFQFSSVSKNLFKKTDLSFLIHHRLEAIDRKNPHLIAPASIGKQCKH